MLGSRWRRHFLDKIKLCAAVMCVSQPEERLLPGLVSRRVMKIRIRMSGSPATTSRPRLFNLSYA